MALKNYTGKIYELLKNCSPDDERITKRYEEEKLFDSPFYHEFMECELTRDIFIEYFSKEKLVSLPHEKYEEIEQCMELIPVMAERLSNAIYFGNGWALREEDTPDLYNPETIKQVIKKLSFKEIYQNDTNIEKKDFMQIFKADKICKEGYYCIPMTVSEVAYNETW